MEKHCYSTDLAYIYIYIVQQTGIKIVKNGIDMKIGTIFKNIMYRVLCIFQLSGSIFECSIVRGPLLGTNFVSTV